MSYTCDWCGTSFNESKSINANANGKSMGTGAQSFALFHFCSMKCYNEWLVSKGGGRNGGGGGSGGDSLAEVSKMLEEQNQRLEEESRKMQEHYDEMVKQYASQDAKTVKQFEAIKIPTKKEDFLEFVMDIASKSKGLQYMPRSENAITALWEKTKLRYASISTPEEQLALEDKWVEISKGQSALQSRKNEREREAKHKELLAKIEAYKTFEFSDNKEEIKNKLEEFYKEYLDCKADYDMLIFNNDSTEDKEHRKLLYSLLKKGFKKYSDVAGKEEADALKKPHILEFLKKFLWRDHRKLVAVIAVVILIPLLLKILLKILPLLFFFL